MLDVVDVSLISRPRSAVCPSRCVGCVKWHSASACNIPPASCIVSARYPQSRYCTVTGGNVLYWKSLALTCAIHTHLVEWQPPAPSHIR